VGRIAPSETLGAIARSAGILFHTDAVQVAGRLPLNVQQLPVDLLSLSSHKLYGPQGVGALYVRPGTDLIPLLIGGGQEGGLRSGTQAVAAIAGFGTAAHLATQNLAQESQRLQHLRERLFEQLADCPYLVATGDRQHRLPHHVSFCARHPEGIRLSGQTLVHQIHLAGIGISSGSACNSGKTIPSRVLTAMGYSDDLAFGAIRITLGRYTTVADIDWTALVLQQVISRMVESSSDRVLV
jgi:cysteine desulfurase